MRHCNYCRKLTDTVDEDCVVCGLSKPYDEELMVDNNEFDEEEWTW